MNTLEVRQALGGFEYRLPYMPWQFGRSTVEATVAAARERFAFDGFVLI